jgi:hypothetical protein
MIYLKTGYLLASFCKTWLGNVQLDWRAHRTRTSRQKRWINPMHREDLFRPAGLDLFQELSTLNQQLTRTFLLR